MNEAPKTTARRWAILISLAAFVAAIVVGGGAYWHQRRLVASLMPLPEVLWVTERDYSRYYAPGTPEARSVAELLVQQDASLAEREFDSFVLYRRGLSEAAPADEPLLFLGFDPSSIPRERVVPAR